MTTIDYSSLETINGIGINSLQNMQVSTLEIIEGTGGCKLVTYNIGTVELLQSLQTTNVLLCVLIVLLFILTTLGSYYIISRILKPYWG